MTGHVPVLVGEVLEALGPASGRTVIDATVGGGGHAYRILETSPPSGRLVGVDRDAAALLVARETLAPFAGRFTLLRGNFADLSEVASSHLPASGILLDLGLSSLQLQDESRGFSFLSGGPLDMRMDPSLETTAADLVNRLPEAELARILFEYGEERRSRAIARRIVRARAEKPLKSASELADIILGVAPRRGRIHPATRSFQALRIAVNGELENLDRALEALAGWLEPGGRAVVIAFHSLEDRRVKQAFRDGEKSGIYRRLTRKPVVPTAEEIDANPRARSAKLRAVERLGG